MTVPPSLTAEEKARLLRALREDAAFREAVQRILLEAMQSSVQELRESIRDLSDRLDHLAMVVEEGFKAVGEALHELTRQVQENSRQIAENSRLIAENTRQIAENGRLIAENGRQIAENGRQIAALTERMERVEAQIAENGRQIAENGRQIAENGRQIAALTERMERVEAQIAENGRQIAENGRQIAALTERMERVEVQIAENGRQIAENGRQIAALTERMERVEVQIAKLTGEIREQRIRLDDVSGVAAEAGAYREIGIWLRGRGVSIAREYLPGELQEHLNVSSVPDGVMLLKTDSGYLFLVYEVTFTIALRDVRRIAEWLRAFREKGWPAIGLVHFRRALPEEDVTHYITEDGREVIHTIPGMRTLREEATRDGVLLMQHGAFPWRPAGWQPPAAIAEVPPPLASAFRW